MMRLSPSQRMMVAVPVSTSSRCTTKSQSTPASWSPATSDAPNASRPTAPIMCVHAPIRAAATAWLAPLPPALVINPLPPTVSPARGMRSHATERSMFMLPNTATMPRSAMETSSSTGFAPTVDQRLCALAPPITLVHFDVDARLSLRQQQAFTGAGSYNEYVLIILVIG